MSSGLFKKYYLQNMFTNHIQYMYKKDLALNDLQRLICHKTKPNQIKPIHLAIRELPLVAIPVNKHCYSSWPHELFTYRSSVFNPTTILSIQSTMVG